MESMNSHWICLQDSVCSDEYGEMLPPDEIFAKVKAVVDAAMNI